MKLAFEMNAWGGVVGTPGAVTDIGSGFYVTPGDVTVGLDAAAAAASPVVAAWSRPQPRRRPGTDRAGRPRTVYTSAPDSEPAWAQASVFASASAAAAASARRPERPSGGRAWSSEQV